MSDDAGSGPRIATAAVATSNGPVRGYREGALSVFKGLRYGAAPVGRLRFMPPQRPAPWSDVAEALAYGAPAIQSGLAPGERRVSAGDPPAPDEPPSSEDCLFLNVWTPGLDNARRPTMVWLHGGGFANGSGGASMYDGGALARRGDVVTVTVNHRLNVFGYLHLGELGGHRQSGQAGMIDIVQALEWVRDNIANFGGDPGNVTIFGESGGGAKVVMLMAMPGAKGLFHKAIVQSGPGLRAVEPDAATGHARQLLDELGVKPGALGKLAELATDVISKATLKVPGEMMRIFSPVVDGVALPRHPFHPDAPTQSANVPVMIGTNKDEATLFMLSDPKFGDLTEEDLQKRAKRMAGDKAEALIAALREIYPDYSPTYLASAVQTATWMWIDSIRLAERKHAQGAAPAFMYMMTWETPVARGKLKCPHALEIPLVFDNVERARNFVGRGEDPQTLVEQMAPAWLAFARRGDPNHAGIPAWPAYDPKTRATMLFDRESRVVSDPNSTVREILKAGDRRGF